MTQNADATHLKRESKQVPAQPQFLLLAREPFTSGRLVDKPRRTNYVVNSTMLRFLRSTEELERITLTASLRLAGVTGGITWLKLTRAGLRNVRPDTIRFATQATALSRLFVEVTSACNLRCLHCYGAFGTAGHPSHLRIPDLRPLAEEAARAGVSHLDYTGGEPMMNPHFRDALALSAELGMLTSVFTSLTIRTAELVDWVEAYGVQHVITSVESLHERTHDTFRGSRFALRRTLDAMAALRAQGVPVTVNVVIGKHNEDSALDTAEALLHDGYAVQIGFMLLQGRATASLMCSPQTRHHILSQAASRGLVKGLRADNDAPPCGIGRSLLFVSAEGNLYPCPSLRNKSFLMGTLTRHPALDQIAEHVNELGASVRCEAACPFTAACAGGCRARALLNHGSIRACDEESREIEEVMSREPTIHT